MSKSFFVSILAFFFLSGLSAQNSGNWKAQDSQRRVFLENKGQFHIHQSSEKVLYAFQEGPMTVFFTPAGVHYTFLKTWRKEKDEEERERERKKKFSTPEEYKEHEEEERRVEFKTDKVSFRWENADPAVSVTAENESSDYFSYCVKNESGGYKNINYVKGFEKITYRNLYPGIDVEFVIHPENGIKYSVIVHPGADLSQLKMNYSESAKMKPNGDLYFSTLMGNLVEHAPVSFYQGKTTETIASSFEKKDKTISFAVGAYDHSRTLIIDPWVQSPAYGTTTWHCVWECEKDGAGNVYTIGGGVSQVAGSQMTLKKYNSAGALQWTYVTPYDTSNVWLGTFATDNAGNSYVTAGSVAQIQKINTSGALVWNNPSPGGAFSGAEFWNIVFNCDQTKLVIGGTGGPLFTLEAIIYDVDVSTGNITTQASVAIGPMSSFPPNLQEVRSISSCPNGKYYYMTHDTIGYINQNFSLCPSGTSANLKIDNGIDLNYKCEDFRFDNSGIMAVRADANFVYVNKGNQLQKRSLSTLAVLATVTIPGGVLNNVTFGGKAVGNSGIDIDDCGNVYVGSVNQVVKFDANLNQLATYATAFTVYDVHVSTSGDIICCGSTGNSSSGNRTGSVQSFAAGACNPIALTCCDATVCQPTAVCQSASPFNLTVATPGGTFSGTGITNTSTGTFDPSVAGVGTFTVTYSLGCGSSSMAITVNSCVALPVCSNSNGSITASGTGPFTWYQQTTTNPCISGAGFVCGPFTVAGPPVTTWTSFSSSATVTPASYPVYVTNSTGDSAYVPSFASLPSCSSCAMTGSISSSTNISCNGVNNGSATAAQTGGSGTITYAWAPSGGTAATATGLSAGTYTCTITAGSCTATATVTITQPSAVSTSTASTAASCGNNNGSATVTASGGTGTLNYSWNPGGQTTATASNLAGGTYTCTVTDAATCTQTVSVVVANGGAPMVSLASQTNNNCAGGANGSATVSASGGTGTLTYSWAPSGGTAASAVNLIAGTYTCTVTDAASCTQTQTVTITEPSPISTATSSVNASCGTSNGSASVSASGGTGTLNYSWNPGGQTASTAVNLSSGSYTCTITDGNACTQTVSVVVNSNGGPAVSLASQTNNTCAGDANGVATVSATGGTGTITYTWSPSGGNAATATGLQAGTYSCVVSDAAGCVQTQTVSITEPPAISTATASANASCGASNGSATVTASGGTGTLGYSWSPGGQTTSTATALAAGTYTCTITDASACSETVSVVVNNTGGPVAVAAANGPLCSGSTINLTSSGGVSYSWSGPNSFSSANQNPSITNATTAAAGTYTVTVTDAGGCTNTATVTIAVNASPSATATATSNSVCAGGTINLNSNGGGTYSWSGPNSFSSAVQNPSIANSTTAASGTYTVTVSSGTCTAAATISVTVNAIPVVVASSNGPVCSGGSANFTASGGGTYAWTGPAGFTSSSQNPTVVITGTVNAGTYSVVVTGANGCTNSASVSLAVGSNSSSSVNTSFCQGGSYILPDGNIATSGGTYTDTLSSFAGCDSIITTNLVMSPTPNVGVAVTSNDTITLGQSVTLTASGALTYVWDNASTASTIIYTPSATGDYTRCVYGTSSAGCIDSQCVDIHVKKLDCGELFLPNAFSPNGDLANDELCIYGSACITSLEFRIFDRWGEKVFESTDPNFCWDGLFKGKKLNPAIFAYYLNATLTSGEEVVLKGNISLVK
jgi:gliding motility-associated-like protein